MNEFMSKAIKGILIACGAGILLAGGYLTFRSKKGSSVSGDKQYDQSEGMTIIEREDPVETVSEIEVIEIESLDSEDDSPIPMIEVLRITEEDDKTTKEASEG